MAAYPTLPTQVGSAIEPVESRVNVRASNGALKARLLHDTERATIRLEHWISAAQKASLESHYSGDKSNSFSYTWPGTGGGTYTVIYAERPAYEEQPGGWFKARVTLAEA